VLQTEPIAAPNPLPASIRASSAARTVNGEPTRTRDSIVLVHSIMARRRLRRLGRIRGRLLP
jgi:hypothetical protein